MKERGKTLLIIDDDVANAQTLAQALRKHGYHDVVFVRDGEEGWMKIRQCRPALVILDALLPTRDGFAICELMKEDAWLRDIPVIMTTTLDPQLLTADGMSSLSLIRSLHRADLLLHKPVSADEIAEHVRVLLHDTPAGAALVPSHERILLIDDDRLNLRLLEVTLMELGYYVTVATKGSDGIALCEREKPALVMLDIVMPDLSGLDILTAIKQHDPSVAVIMMTAHGSEELAVEAMKLGASDYLVKPINYQRVGTVVKEHLEKSRLRAAEERLSRQLRESSLELLHRVAELEEARRKLEQTHKELERANMLKTEFVSVVSHELRTPLTNVRGYVELLLDGTAGDINATQQEYLEIVQANCDRLIAIVNDLLDISRIESGNLSLHFQRLVLQDLIHEVTRSLAPQFEEKNIALQLHLAKDDLPILGDRERVIQILNNLLSNARKYTPRGGRVDVKAYRDNDFVQVDIADTGIGIPAHDQPHIFEKFYRAENSFVEETRGTGLGLAIAKSLVELHRGRIWLESEVGKGSTFSFCLPLLEPSESRRQMAAQTTDATARVEE